MGIIALLLLIFLSAHVCGSDRKTAYAQLIAIQLLSVVLHFIMLSLQFVPLCIRIKVMDGIYFGSCVIIDTTICGGWFMGKSKNDEKSNESVQKASFCYLLVQIPFECSTDVEVETKVETLDTNTAEVRNLPVLDDFVTILKLDLQQIDPNTTLELVEDKESKV